MKRKKITVFWEDHHERDGHGEATSQDRLKPIKWETRGFLVGENEEMIEVVRDVTDDPDTVPYGASLRIMKKCILKRSDKKEVMPE